MSFSLGCHSGCGLEQRMVQPWAAEADFKGRARAEYMQWNASLRYSNPSRAQGPSELEQVLWYQTALCGFFSCEFIQTLPKPIQAPMSSSSKNSHSLAELAWKSMSLCLWWSPCLLVWEGSVNDHPFIHSLVPSCFYRVLMFPLSHHFSNPTNPLMHHGVVPCIAGNLMITEASVVFTMASRFLWCPRGRQAGRDFAWVLSPAPGQSPHRKQHGETVQIASSTGS